MIDYPVLPRGWDGVHEVRPDAPQLAVGSFTNPVSCDVVLPVPPNPNWPNINIFDRVHVTV